MFVHLFNAATGCVCRTTRPLYPERLCSELEWANAPDGWRTWVVSFCVVPLLLQHDWLVHREHGSETHMWYRRITGSVCVRPFNPALTLKQLGSLCSTEARRGGDGGGRGGGDVRRWRAVAFADWNEWYGAVVTIHACSFTSLSPSPTPSLSLSHTSCSLLEIRRCSNTHTHTQK